MKKLHLFAGLLLLLLMTSCSSTSKLVTSAVAYQSVRSVEYKDAVPDDAKIAVGYSITPTGELIVVVENKTDEIMIIDQTKSFFVNTDGRSVSYYDPTVRTTTNTTINSDTRGASVNLGAIAGAAGIGGGLGKALGGINVGGANTNTTSSTNTTYIADLPQISIAPHSMETMSKNFEITGIGKQTLGGDRQFFYTKDDARLKFSVCISYSVDGGNNYDKIVTPFYCNSLVSCDVKSHGQVNEALRTILRNKPDALREQWWVLWTIANMSSSNDNIWNGSFIDWK